MGSVGTRNCRIALPAPRSPRLLAACLVLLVVMPCSLIRSADANDAPRWATRVEQVETRRLLIDVHVTDEDGHALPGLTIDDFAVFLDGRQWPVKSVDDLCSCPASPSENVSATQIGQRGAAEGAGRRIIESLEREERDPRNSTEGATAPLQFSPPVRFVLYMDFSQLTTDARNRAFEQARRWILEARKPDDQVMVVAYASGTGLGIIEDFTREKDALLQALAGIESDPKWIDQYAVTRLFHRDKCHDCLLRNCRSGIFSPGTACAKFECGSECFDHAMNERRILEAGMTGLRLLLSSLEDLEGRKEILFFHQTGTMFPGRVYGVSDWDVGDLVQEVERVGAEATLARARIHAVSLRSTRAGTNFGANLADVGGGIYSRGAGDVPDMLDSIGRECCWYTLAIEPPARADGRTHRIRVDVRGRTMGGLRSVAFLTPRQRWHRMAQGALLAGAEKSESVPLSAALLPVGLDGSRWELKVQVALSPGFLQSLPDQVGQRVEWGLGALVVENGGQDVHALERFAAALFDDTAARILPVVLHEAMIRVRPGHHELRAYGGDVHAWTFSGEWMQVELPDPEEGGTYGPLLHCEHPAVRLELYEEHDTPPKDAPVDSRQAGQVLPVPVDGPLQAGDVASATTVICPGESSFSEDSLERTIEQDGGVRYRFSEADALEALGSCFRLTDRFAVLPSVLAPGTYTYVVRGIPETAGVDTTPQVHFEVAESR